MAIFLISVCNRIINTRKSIDHLLDAAIRHNLKFLNKSQVGSYYNLEPSEQEAIKLYISERSFYSQRDVLNLINEAISQKSETTEQNLIVTGKQVDVIGTILHDDSLMAEMMSKDKYTNYRKMFFKARFNNSVSGEVAANLHRLSQSRSVA